MELTKAIEQAEKFTDEETVPFDHWRVVMDVLLEEVKKGWNPANEIHIYDRSGGELLQVVNAETTETEFFVCSFDRGNESIGTICKSEPNEPQGPLPAAILAGELDHLADELADKAKEIDIYSGLKYEGAIKAIGAFKTFLVLTAKQIREDK